MTQILSIGLVAHDQCKQKLCHWTHKNKDFLQPHTLYGTGTTARLITEKTGLQITPLLSGPLGGDQQLGAKIAEGALDCLIFFTDPMASLPHDVDVKALVRLSTLHNIFLACNMATADLIITHPDLCRPDRRQTPDFEDYLNRQI